jgi:hypothetical protein
VKSIPTPAALYSELYTGEKDRRAARAGEGLQTVTLGTDILHSSALVHAFLCRFVLIFLNIFNEPVRIRRDRRR